VLQKIINSERRAAGQINYYKVVEIHRPRLGNVYANRAIV
jgi:hypothetical protein